MSRAYGKQRTRVRSSVSLIFYVSFSPPHFFKPYSPLHVCDSKAWLLLLPSVQPPVDVLPQAAADVLVVDVRVRLPLVVLPFANKEGAALAKFLHPPPHCRRVDVGDLACFSAVLHFRDPISDSVVNSGVIFVLGECAVNGVSSYQTAPSHSNKYPTATFSARDAMKQQPRSKQKVLKQKTKDRRRQHCTFPALTHSSNRKCFTVRITRVVRTRCVSSSIVVESSTTDL